MERITYTKNSLILVFSLFIISALSFAQTNSPNISNGESVYIEKHGFYFTPPEGWEIIKNSAIAFEVRIPKKEDQVYRGNIKIYKRNEHLIINDRSINGIKDELMQNFADKAMISDYEIRSHDTYLINETTNTVIIYADYNMGNIALMQANVFVPHAEGRLVLSYTDFKDKVDGPNSDFFTSFVWPALASVQLDVTPEYPYKNHIIVGSVILGLFLIFCFLLIFKRISSSKLYSKELDDEQNEKSSSLEFSQHELEDGAKSLVEDISDEAQALEREMEAFSQNSPFSIQENVRLQNVDGKNEAIEDEDDDDEFESVV